MIVLGWHGGIKRIYEDAAPGWSTHDGAAVLMRDGKVLAAIEEERLNRIKHSNFFPSTAIGFCLREGGITLSNVDAIAMNFAEMPREVFAQDSGRPSPDMFLENATMRTASVRDTIGALFSCEFSTDVSNKLFFCNHHVAHLFSALYFSGCNEGLVVSLDGSGDGLSGMVALAENGNLNILRELAVEESLGDLYSDSIRFLGFKRFDEFKAMGLAPYGNPDTYSTLFRSFYRLLPDGAYELVNRHERWARIQEVGLLEHARRHGEPFTQVHKDFAAALQNTLENIVLHMLDYFHAKTGQQTLCMAGGVGHNCTLNGKILYQGRFSKVFVQPASHDAGGALGAAIAVFKDTGAPVSSQKLHHLYFGTDVGHYNAIPDALEIWSAFLSYEKVDHVAAKAANLLADGAVVGWVQDRSEFGPRALGNRSILADPRPAENKALINQMVKKREAYRPFAPSICEERLSDFFDLPPTEADYSFMIHVLSVREEMRSRLAAVTHVDGTARLQTVSRAVNPKFWQLIHEFDKLTGIPVLLNTSFNSNAEPIVDSVEDAIVCFLTTGINFLFLGDYFVRKQTRENSDPLYLTLAPSLPTSRKLVRRVIDQVGAAKDIAYSIETTASRYFTQTYTRISEDLFQLLLATPGKKTIAELCREVGLVQQAQIQKLTDELLELWGQRVLILRPRS